MSHNLIDTITGALAADAAAMGLHWLYDQNQIQSLEATGDILFRPADANVYIDRKGFFAQAGKLAGELSHYGESMRLAGELGAVGQFTAAAYQQAFFAAFGPCGTFTGYADRPTKAFGPILKLQSWWYQLTRMLLLVPACCLILLAHWPMVHR